MNRLVPTVNITSNSNYEKYYLTTVVETIQNI